jgi:hypothetical protein
LASLVALVPIDLQGCSRRLASLVALVPIDLQLLEAAPIPASCGLTWPASKSAPPPLDRSPLDPVALDRVAPGSPLDPVALDRPACALDSWIEDFRQ